LHKLVVQANTIFMIDVRLVDPNLIVFIDRRST
jgi:hypothetical protein